MKRVPITFLAFLMMAFFSISLQAQFTASACDVTFSNPSPAAITLNESVVMNFTYETDDPGGIRVFILPQVDGSYAGAFGNSGSVIYNGSGTGSYSFQQIDNEEGVVDEVEVRVTNADQSEVYQRYFLPVEYHYGEVAVGDFSLSAPDSSSFLLDEDLTIGFDYEVNTAGPVRIFLRPFSNGSLTPGYAASGSPSYSGTGSGSANFSIGSGFDVLVDEIRVQITNDDQSQTLKEFFIPVHYQWSTVKVSDIAVNLAYGSFPFNGDDTEVTMNYATTQSGGVRIFIRPWTHGGLTSGYAASGSPLYPTGAGTADGSFTFDDGNHVVDHIRIQVTNADQSQILLTYFLPYRITYGFSWVEFIDLCPQTPARLYHGEDVNLGFDVYNDEGEDVRIFARPFTDGALSPAYAASGSPTYAPGNLISGDGYFTINTGDVVVDEIRFQVVRASNDELLSEFFIPVHYEFGEPDVSSVTQADTWEGTISELQPNPAREQVAFQLELPATQDVEVLLLNNLGHQVQTVFSGKVVAGQSQWIEFDLADNLVPGIYYVQVQSTAGRVVKRLIVQ